MAKSKTKKTTRASAPSVAPMREAEPADADKYEDGEGFAPVGEIGEAAARPRVARGAVPLGRKARLSSARQHAKNAAKREVANHERLSLLREWQDALATVRRLDARVYASLSSEDEVLQLHDADHLSDGLSGDGGPLRAAIAHELSLVTAALRFADATPESPDDLDATTAAIMMERGASDYSATAAVFYKKKIPPSAIAASSERAMVRRADERRRNAKAGGAVPPRRTRDAPEIGTERDRERPYSK